MRRSSSNDSRCTPSQLYLKVYFLPTTPKKGHHEVSQVVRLVDGLFLDESINTTLALFKV